jgi:DNA-binding CsgD family transcriptional regulator
VRNGQIWTNNEQLSFVIEALTQLPSLHVINARGESLLTPREEEVVTLVAEGLTNRSIARQLRVTENTVKKSLLRIFDKLGISNRVELVLYALTERKTTEPDTSTNSEDAPRMETRSSGVAEPPGRAFRPGLRSLELVTVESAS